MLYDIEKSIMRMESRLDSKQFRDLVYDLESFIIDYGYGDDDTCADRSSYLGKVELANKVQFERERELICSKIRPVLSDLGIHESVKGFRLIEGCIVEASRIACESEIFYMRDVYPIVAKEFGINAHNCERLCRYACKYVNATTAFARKYPFFEELTHRTYECVTVKELVDIFVRYVLVKFSLKSKKYMYKSGC